MNGFTNAILSLLLGWIRVFINSLWRMVNSENGSHFIQFLVSNWKILLLVLCVGGFVLDRLIYLFRWRPYYVWLSKRRRRRWERNADVSQPAPAEEAWEDAPPPNPYAPPVQPFAHAFPAPPPFVNAYGGASMAQPTAAWQRPQPAAYPQQPAAYPPQPAAYPPQSAATLHYAPVAQGGAAAAPFQAQPYVPPDDLSPVFDDDLGGWNEGDTLVRPLPNGIHEVASNMPHAFGSAKPEPIDYIRDMQAGFAKPAPPEELYAGAAVQAPKPAMQETPVALDPRMPIHPGLDMANFRRNIGLAPAGSLSSQQGNNEDASGFRPYSNADRLSSEAAHPRNPFASLAKKARGFVGVTEDEDKPTIRDLQSTVDVRTAFHEPVYPKPVQRKESDRP